MDVNNQPLKEGHQEAFKVLKLSIRTLRIEALVTTWKETGGGERSKLVLEGASRNADMWIEYDRHPDVGFIHTLV